MSEFIGHLHPAIVHLPIGVLLIALLLIFLSKKTGYNISYEVIKIVLLTGVFAALISCITGYLLSTQDNYEKPLVVWHMWMGIGVAIVSMLLYMKLARKEFGLVYKIFALQLLALIIVTGHLGGSLTHGSNYLSFSPNDNDSVILKPIANVQEAKTYADIVQPIFQTKCYSCHSSKKQKGGLRLDKFELVLKGGKDGKIIETNNPDRSELIKRLLLPNENEDHMPPKDKPQLTAKQIMLLHWWVANGNDTARTVKEMPQPDSVKLALLSLQADHIPQKLPAIIPAAPVAKADEKPINQLKEKSIIILPVAQNSNYLSANFITATNITDKDFALLLPVKQQLAWLKCGNIKITDSAIFFISQCSNLTFLQLNNTLITNKGLVQLAALQQLQSLNLVGTNISATGLLALKNLKQLQSVYLYQTKINSKEFVLLQKAFPKVLLDSGSYRVPFLPGDTVVIKTPVY